MKKFFWLINVFSLTLVISGCRDVRRGTGRVYMPDMNYSRAYETYAQLDSAKFTSDSTAIGEGKIYFTARPVTGTMARNDAMRFEYAMDKPGDSTNFVASKQATNPLPPLLDPAHIKEAERLYLVNCAVCHGAKLDGNGPLWKDGSGPYTSAPKNLVTSAMPDGQMFHVMTYGKGMMGSYASQVTTSQRWLIIQYIKLKQQAGTTGTAKTGTDTTAKATTPN